MTSRSAVLRTAALAAICGVLGFAEARALAAPVQFATTLEQSVWEIKPAEARCVLRHAIPDFGAAEFLRLPGRGLQLRIDLPKPPVEAHAVMLRAVPPGWNHQAQAREFGSHLIKPGARGLILEEAEAQALFDALAQGLYVELAFGPVGAPAQALVKLTAVRFLPTVPSFEACVAALRLPSPRTPSRSRAQVAALPEPQRDVPVAGTAPRPLPPGAGASENPPPASVAAPPVQEDPYIRSDAPVQSVAKAQTGTEVEPKQDKEPRKDPGAGLNLVTELALQYGLKQDRLSDAARLELAAFAREYLAGKRSDLVLIAGSAADGAQTRRRALEIKGFLVRNGLPAARVLIHVQGEKLPQRDGQPVDPPGEASRMAVWQVR